MPVTADVAVLSRVIMHWSLLACACSRSPARRDDQALDGQALVDPLANGRRCCRRSPSSSATYLKLKN